MISDTILQAAVPFGLHGPEEKPVQKKGGRHCCRPRKDKYCRLYRTDGSICRGIAMRGGVSKASFS